MIVVSAHRTDATQRFLTYRYYLRALTGLAGFAHPAVDVVNVYPGLAARIVAMPTCRPRGTRAYDSQVLKRSLTNAWGTELLLSLSGEYAVDDELLRITNNWAAVQLYYVFYHATQALVVARGDARPESHPKTKSAFMDLWTARSLDCAPWTLGYKTAPVNVPASHIVGSQVTTVARPRSAEDFVNYAFKALYTTRKEAIPGALKSQRQAKQRDLVVNWDRAETERLRLGRRPRVRPRFALPTLTDEEKTAGRDSVRCYTIMDILWRLRTRTNYRDGLMFIEGPMDDEGTTELNADMRHLASATMLLCEMHIRQQIGIDAMRALTSAWLEHNKVATAAGVGQRLSLVLT